MIVYANVENHLFSSLVIRLEMYYAVHSRPRVGRMRPIWRVIAAITPMRRPHAFNGGTVVKD